MGTIGAQIHEEVFTSEEMTEELGEVGSPRFSSTNKQQELQHQVGRQAVPC